MPFEESFLILFLLRRVEVWAKQLLTKKEADLGTGKFALPPDIFLVPLHCLGAFTAHSMTTICHAAQRVCFGKQG